MAAVRVARRAVPVARVRVAHRPLARTLAQSAVGCGDCRTIPNVGESAFGSAVCVRTPTHSCKYFLAARGQVYLLGIRLLLVKNDRFYLPPALLGNR